jgi:hypothetical protein
MKNEKYYSQMSIYFKTHLAFRMADEFFVSSNKTWQFGQTLHYIKKQLEYMSLLLMNKCIIFL